MSSVDTQTEIELNTEFDISHFSMRNTRMTTTLNWRWF